LAKCPCAVNKLKTFAWCRKGRKREIEIKKKITQREMEFEIQKREERRGKKQEG
jgi:hypothetical protein